MTESHEVPINPAGVEKAVAGSNEETGAPFNPAQRLFSELPKPLTPEEQKKQDKLYLDMLQGTLGYFDWLKGERQLTEEEEKKKTKVEENIRGLSEKLGIKETKENNI